MSRQERRVSAGGVRKPFNGLIKLDGQKLHISVKPGRGPGTPLLICNGIGANLELLDPFVEEIEAVDVIRFDVPGTGRSPMPPMPYRMRSLAKLVDRLLDELGYDQVDVLGLSWGGFLAQQFAWSHPRRCRRLILAATVAGGAAVPGRLSVMAKMLTPRRYNEEGIVAMAADLYGGVFRTNPELAAQHWQRIHGVRGQGYFFQMLAAWGWTSVFWLRLIAQPTLVLTGRDDPLAPPINGWILASMIPDARLRELDCGHLFILTCAREVAEIVRDFLDMQNEADLAASAAA